jgi:hypothetical protein
MYKGRLKGFPVEVVEKMLEKQIEQGNPKNVAIFENKKEYKEDLGGFNWNKTIEGHSFWEKVIYEKDFDFFFQKYPKIETSEYPKVMWVWDALSQIPKKRVVFAEKCGMYISWYRAETLEDSENQTQTNEWAYAKDIEPEFEIKQFTLDDIAKILQFPKDKFKIIY